MSVGGEFVFSAKGCVGMSAAKFAKPAALWAAALIAAAGRIPSAAAQDREAYTLSVHVEDESGRDVSGASVEVSSESVWESEPMRRSATVRSSGRSTASGEWLVGAELGGARVLRLSVSADGFVPRSVLASAEVRPSVEHVVLAPMGAASLVVVGEDGAPVQGATVYVRAWSEIATESEIRVEVPRLSGQRSAPLRSRSDEQGVVSFTGLSSGTRYVAESHKSGVGMSAASAFVAGRAMAQDDEPIILTITPFGDLELTIVDAAGVPIESPVVRMHGESAESLGSRRAGLGVVRFGGLGAGLHRVDVGARGYEWQRRTVEIRSRTVVRERVELGRVDEAVGVVMSRAGAPLPGVAVTTTEPARLDAWMRSEPEVTDAEGRFRIAVVLDRQGEAVLVAPEERWRSVPRRWWAVAIEKGGGVFCVDDPCELVFPESLRSGADHWRVSFVDPATGAPSPRLERESMDISEWVRAEGRVRLWCAGTVLLRRVGANRLGNWAQYFELTAGKRVVVTPEERPVSEAIRIRVVRDDGSAIAGATFSLFESGRPGEGEVTCTRVAERQGEFDLRGVPGGSPCIAIAADGCCTRVFRVLKAAHGGVLEAKLNRVSGLRIRRNAAAGDRKDPELRVEREVVPGSFVEVCRGIADRYGCDLTLPPGTYRVLRGSEAGGVRSTTCRLGPGAVFQMTLQE